MDNQQFTILLDAIKSNSKAIESTRTELKTDIKELKTELKELNANFNDTKNKVARQGGILWIFGIALAILFTGILNFALGIIN